MPQARVWLRLFFISGIIMLVKVSDIPAEGFKVKLVEDADSLKGLSEDTRLAGPADAAFSLKVVGQTVYVTGRVSATLELDCSRCGKSFPFAVDADVRFDMYPVESLDREEEKELEGGELDVEFYSGGVIDLGSLVAEQLELGIPMKPLCSEGCRGVCQYCGKDKNEGECGCEAEVGHIGLAGLKELLDNMKVEGEEEDGKPD